MSWLSQGYCAEGCADWSGRYQPYRFKLELAAELPSLHRCSPADESTLSRCPENRQQATQIKRHQSDNKNGSSECWSRKLDAPPKIVSLNLVRSEESRVGIECVSTCRYWWASSHEKE